MKHILPIMTLFTLLGAAAPARAEEEPTVVREPDRTVFAKETRVTFSEVEVSGTVTRPEGSFVHSRKTARFRCLVRIRGDFRPELERSVDAL